MVWSARDDDLTNSWSSTWTRPTISTRQFQARRSRSPSPESNRFDSGRIGTAGASGAGGLPLAAARNQGATVATQSTLLFCDVDCIPSADTVDEHARHADPDVLVCGPVRYLRQGWQLAASDPKPDISLELQSSPHPVRPAPERTTDDERHELFWSLLFAIERNTWNDIGGFDEHYVGYGAEDTDLAMTARANNVKIRWLPAGAAYHQWHPSSSPPVEHLVDIVDNANRFRQKWGWWPMHGWLQAFAEQDLIDWQPTAQIATLRHDTKEADEPGFATGVNG